MKITTQSLLLTIVIILGFSPLALSKDSLLLNTPQETPENNANLKRKNPRPEANKSVFEQFSLSTDEILEIKLTTDLQNLLVNKNTDDYQLAFLEMKDASGQNIKHQLKIKSRGKYRRKICNFPPLKLNFSKEKLLLKGLYPEFDKLKLVTHCTKNETEAKKNVLREYIAYKLYNILTDNSFRTQLVKIEYVDLHNSAQPFSRYGFLIEDKDEMATRLSGKIIEERGLSADMVSQHSYELTAMYQYMIGNADWNLPNLHNVKLIETLSGNTKNSIVVPYDFDFTGLVNAPYAVPNTNLNHTKITQRHFSGSFSSAEALEKMSVHFLSKKKEILQLVRKFKILNADARYEMDIYLQEFFLILKNKKHAAKIFLNKENIESNEKIPVR